MTDSLWVRPPLVPLISCATGERVISTEACPARSIGYIFDNPTWFYQAMQQLQNLDIDVLVDVSMKADLTYYFNMYNTEVSVRSMLVWDRCIGGRGEGSHVDLFLHPCETTFSNPDGKLHGIHFYLESKWRQRRVHAGCACGVASQGRQGICSRTSCAMTNRNQLLSD